jgi:hypothetical protein
MLDEIYYICPSCGDLVTKKDLLSACENGGLPFCYCEFLHGSILIRYKRITKNLWNKLKNIRLKELK